MSDENKPQGDPAVEAELAGVPDELLDKETDKLGEALDRLREDLEAAKQEVLYAKAETQNVRRRLEKDIADARAYAATGFARDILSVSDNLSVTPTSISSRRASTSPSASRGWKTRRSSRGGSPPSPSGSSRRRNCWKGTACPPSRRIWPICPVSSIQTAAGCRTGNSAA